MLNAVELRIPLHGQLGIVGSSGCGKTTLLEILAGLTSPDAGACTIATEPPKKTGDERLTQCALMPQEDLLLPWRTALGNACIALENHGLSRREARTRAHPLFKRFGLAEFESARPAELSGGMRQRVAFLRTLLADKEVLLLDEPFGALDSISRAEMQVWLLRALADQPKTTVLVSHDVEEALYLCDQVAVMSRRPGTVVAKLDAKIGDGAPRRDVVTSPEFSRLKEEALEMLESRAREN